MNRQTILAFVAFVVTSAALSFAFGLLPALQLYDVDLRATLCSLGPLLGGLLCYRLFDVPAAYSFAGHSTDLHPKWTLLGVCLAFLIEHARQDLAYNLVWLFTGLLYAFGQEYGWRHYLHSATSTLRPWAQVLLIAICWFGWHAVWHKDPVYALIGDTVGASAEIRTAVALGWVLVLSAFLRWVLVQSGSWLMPVIIIFGLKAGGQTANLSVGMTIMVLLQRHFIRPAKAVL